MLAADEVVGPRVLEQLLEDIDEISRFSFLKPPPKCTALLQRSQIIALQQARKTTLEKLKVLKPG